MRYFWQMILAGLLFAGCESIIEVDQASPYDSKVVVRGIFGPDSVWSIHLGLSQKLNAAGPPVIWPDVWGATVTVSNSAQTRYRLYDAGEGWYRVRGDDFPVAGETYDLFVTLPVVGELTASSSVPEVESTLVSHFVRPDTSRWYGDERCEALVQITDTPSADYYLIRVQRDGSTDGVYPKEWVTFSSTAAALRQSPNEVIGWSRRDMHSSYYAFGAWFSDDLFEDSTYEVDIDCEGSPDRGRPYIFRVVVMALSRELFEYEQTASKLQDYLDSGLSFVQRPPDVKSNIVGGLGIFGGYGVAVHEFRYIE